MVQSSLFKDIKPVRFYRSDGGREPVREWLRKLVHEPTDKTIGRDVLTLQLGWPLGMPLARKLEYGLWEVRSKLNNGIARIIFTVKGDNILLLHGFVKKSRKTPKRDLRSGQASGWRNGMTKMEHAGSSITDEKLHLGKKVCWKTLRP